MSYLYEIIGNKILVSGVISWAIAQVLKTLIYLCVNRKFEIERLFGDGGMPSGHSATVTAVAVSAGIQCGLSSPTFAVATILAIVVMHDAMGVRLETGKQAKVINDMVEMIEKLGGTDLTNEEKLKEFVGHTPLQVAMGFVLGIIVAIVFNLA
ncbi:MAG: divergent PAP2 family protein [Eubacterium sp.]|nr:divergent PAP2 family protein [Eubacterium sp.]